MDNCVIINVSGNLLSCMSTEGGWWWRVQTRSKVYWGKLPLVLNHTLAETGSVQGTSFVKIYNFVATVGLQRNVSRTLAVWFGGKCSAYLINCSWIPLASVHYSIAVRIILVISICQLLLEYSPSSDGTLHSNWKSLSVFTVLYNRVISGLCCSWINGHLLKNLM
jgi:hypothetical protein